MYCISVSVILAVFGNLVTFLFGPTQTLEVCFIGPLSHVFQPLKTQPDTTPALNQNKRQKRRQEVGQGELSVVTFIG